MHLLSFAISARNIAITEKCLGFVQMEGGGGGHQLGGISPPPPPPPYQSLQGDVNRLNPLYSLFSNSDTSDTHHIAVSILDTYIHTYIHRHIHMYIQSGGSQCFLELCNPGLMQSCSASCNACSNAKLLCNSCLLQSNEQGARFSVLSAGLECNLVLFQRASYVTLHAALLRNSCLLASNVQRGQKVIEHGEHMLWPPEAPVHLCQNTAKPAIHAKCNNARFHKPV